MSVIEAAQKASSEEYIARRIKNSKGCILHRLAKEGEMFNLRFEISNMIQNLSPQKISRVVDMIDKSTGRTPLIEAASNGHLDVVKMLHNEFHANLNKSSLLGNTTALHAAVENGYREIVIYLVFNGAKLDAKDSQGNTVLHNVKSLNMAKLLQKFEVDPTCRNKAGLRPSQYYVQYTDETVIKKTLLNFLCDWEYSHDLELVHTSKSITNIKSIT